MHDRLAAGIKTMLDRFQIAPGVKEIPDVKRLQVLISVELFVVGIGDRLELRLVLGRQHRRGIAPKIAAGHRHNVRLVANDEGRELRTQPVVRAGGDVMEFIHRDQPVIESFNAKFVHGKAEGRVGAYQHRIAAFQELANRFHLGGINLFLVRPRRIAQVPLRFHSPVGPEAVLA